MQYTHIIIHYNEIILKGGNRPFFEHALVCNIKEFLSEAKYKNIYKEGGKTIIEIKKETDLKKITGILKNIPGISNFYFAVSAEKDMEKIKEKTVKILNSHKDIEKYKTFKIEARRSDKRFELKSPEINAKVGEYVLENTKLKVDVHDPDLEIVIDIGSKNSFIYF